MNALVRVQRFFREQVFYSDTPPAERQAFEEYLARTTARLGTTMAIVYCLSAFLWWPADFVLFPDSPAIRRVALDWRFGNLACLFPLLFQRLWPQVVRERPLPLIAFCTALCCGWTTWNTGRIGPADASWFGLTYVVPTTSMMLFAPFLERTLITIVFAVAAWIGYFGLNPARLGELHDQLGLAASQQAITAFLGIGLGHIIFDRVRMTFFAERSLAAANQLLEDRVRAQRADLRRLADRIETLRETERVEIARELHDELGQTLTALRLETTHIARQGTRAGVDVSPDELDFHVTDMFGAFRRILLRLRPKILDDFGLVAAAQWLVNDQAAQTGIAVSLRVTPDTLAIHGAGRAVAYRALREALSNTLRHARAQQVAVELKLDEGVLRLSVADDGVGIAPRQQWPAEAIGIIGARERARTLGGDFTVERRPQGGTMALLRLPLEPPTPELSS